MRVLPPGSYVARAKVKSGAAVLGEVRRAVHADRSRPCRRTPSSVAGAPGDVGHGALAPRRHRGARGCRECRRSRSISVTSPQVLGAFLDRVAARPDAASPMIRDSCAMPAPNIGQLYVSDVLAAQSPVAAFLKGVSLLSQNKLEPAASCVPQRHARVGGLLPGDGLPRRLLCGRRQGQGGRGRLAHRAHQGRGRAAAPYLLADALLRQDNGELALETLDKARSRWPADDGLKRRFVLAAFMAGEYADGLLTLDELVERKTDDEPTLAAGLLVLYEAFRTGKPIETEDKDRARMVKLADAYRARGGPSMALIDTWLAAAKK